MRLLKCSSEESEDIASLTALKNPLTSPRPQRISGVLNRFLEKSEDQEALVIKFNRIFSENSGLRIGGSPPNSITKP